MKKSEITYSLGRTIQVVQFNPINFHASIKAEITEKDDIEKCFAELKKIVKKQVRTDVEEAISAKKEAEDKKKYPLKKEKELLCSVCGGRMLRSKAGNLYCENIYKNYPGNPHTTETPQDPKIEKFNKSLK